MSLGHEDPVRGVAAGTVTRIVECKHGRSDYVTCTGWSMICTHAIRGSVPSDSGVTRAGVVLPWLGAMLYAMSQTT